MQRPAHGARSAQTSLKRVPVQPGLSSRLTLGSTLISLLLSLLARLSSIRSGRQCSVGVLRGRHSPHRVSRQRETRRQDPAAGPIRTRRRRTARQPPAPQPSGPRAALPGRGMQPSGRQRTESTHVCDATCGWSLDSAETAVWLRVRRMSQHTWDHLGPGPHRGPRATAPTQPRKSQSLIACTVADTDSETDTSHTSGHTSTVTRDS